jgi:gas vesicle protein
MRHSTDRESSRQDHEGGSFAIGLLAGTAIGIGLGVLFAPRPGAELRGQLTDQANDLASSASRQYQRATSTASNLAARGREMYGQAREAVNRGTDEAQRYVRDQAEAISDDLAEATMDTEGSPL